MKAKFVFEQFDDPELKKRVGHIFTKKELADLAKNEPYKNKFQTGAYHGRDSAELNKKISQATTTYKDKDAIGLTEIAYRLLTDEIPGIKKYKVNDLGTNNVHALHLKNTVKLPGEKLDDDYSAKVDIWITYYPEEDDILEYEKDKFKFLMAPKITTSRVGVGLHELPAIDKGEEGMKDLENALESEENFDKFMSRLSKVLGGSPDKEDEYFNKKSYMSVRNITLDEFLELIPEIENKLRFFNKYVQNKYGVTVL